MDHRNLQVGEIYGLQDDYDGGPTFQYLRPFDGEFEFELVTLAHLTHHRVGDRFTMTEGKVNDRVFPAANFKALNLLSEIRHG